MKIEEVLWLGNIVEKIERKHQVKQHEIREIFDNQPYFRYIEKGHRQNENVYAGMGLTNSGRYLIVFFIYKKNKQAIILSARNMTQTERRRYEQR